MIATLKTHVAYVGETQDARMEGVILYVDNISSGTGVTTLEQIHDDYLVIASSIPLMHTYAEIAKARDDLRVQTQLFSEETKAQMVKYNGSNDAMKPYISLSVNATEEALSAVNASLWLAGDSARLTLFNKDSDNRFFLIRSLGKEGIDTTVMKNISGQIDAQRAGLQAALSNQSADALKATNTAIKTLNRQFRENVASCPGLPRDRDEAGRDDGDEITRANLFLCGPQELFMHAPQDCPATFTYTPIGTIHSPFHDIAGMPIQPNGARDVPGTVEILAPYREGLRDLDGFERIILIYAFHRCADHQSHGQTLPRPHAAGHLCHPFAETPERDRPLGGPAHRRERRDAHDRGRGRAGRHPAPRPQAVRAGVRRVPGSRCGWLEAIAGNAETVRSDDRFR